MDSLIEEKVTTRSTITSFEDFEVYKRAYKISLDVHSFSLTLPKIEQYALADQLRRASKSICANFAEGFGKQKQSSGEFRRFVNMSLGSSDEMRVWLNYCHDLGYLNQVQWQEWRNKYISISKMLQALIHKL